MRMTAIAAMSCAFLINCASVQPKPEPKPAPPPAPAKLAAGAPQGWLIQEAQTADGLEAFKLMRLNEQGMVVAEAAVIRQPAKGFDVAGTLDQVAEAVIKAGGVVIPGTGGGASVDRVTYSLHLQQQNLDLKGLVLFKRLADRPDELVAVTAQWLADEDATLRPEIDLIIAAATIK